MRLEGGSVKRAGVALRHVCHRAARRCEQVKYGTHPLFAEFFCTITSPAYAAPCSLWFRAEAARFPPGFHVALACCALTALWSTVYHARLSKALTSPLFNLHDTNAKSSVVPSQHWCRVLGGRKAGLELQDCQSVTRCAGNSCSRRSMPGRRC